jgi:hypothetical protein
MRLLAVLQPALTRLFPPGHVLFTFGVIAFLIGLEIVGRHSTNDREDLLAVFSLFILFTMVALRHRRTPHPWMGLLQDRIQGVLNQLEKLRNECGVDLRGTPPIPRRTPRWVQRSVAVLAAFLGAGILAWVAFPAGWREFGVTYSYLAYLIVLGFVWMALLFTLVGCIYVPMQSLCGPLRKHSDDEDSRSTEMIAFLAYFILVSVLAWMTPPLIPIALAAFVVILAWVVVARPGGDQPAVLWQRPGSARVYSIPLHRVLAGVVGMVGVLVLGVLVLACGGRLLAPPDQEAAMLATNLIGAAVAWTIPGLVVFATVRILGFRRNDPSRRLPPAIHVSGHATPEDYSKAARTLKAKGWHVVLAPARRKPDMVAIELVPLQNSEATEFDPRWPLKVSVSDLDSAPVMDRLTRRDEITQRRYLVKGLHKLFHRVAHHKGTDGGGFLFAPQWWFIDGLTREDNERPKGQDEEPAGLRRVGPGFHTVWPKRARQHFHAILRGTQVDLIFVEDGVKPRAIEKVVRALFELYDVHAGRKKAEDFHFQGLNKVRVVIHDYEPGKTFHTGADYDESKFNDLTRLRILHIFKDKGDHEERVEPPADFSWEPQPLAFG